MKMILILITGLVMAWPHDVASQGIVYTTFDSYLPPSSVDLAGNGQNDFAVNWCGYFIGTTDIPQSASATYWTMSVLSDSKIGLGDGGGVAAGSVIGASSDWYGAGVGTTLTRLSQSLQNGTSWSGVLAPDASGLMALSFTAQDGLTHYGWMQFRQANPPTSTEEAFEFGPQIAAVAWNTVPNQSILAGQVPEPSACFLLAFSGVALVLMRRKSVLQRT